MYFTMVKGRTMKLKEYLEMTKLTPFQFAMYNQLTPSTIYLYIAGTSTPRKMTKKRIKQATKGQVGLDDWGKNE